jgi:hypothetical protein
VGVDAVVLQALQAEFFDALEPRYGPEVAAVIAAPLVEIVRVWMLMAQRRR